MARKTKPASRKRVKKQVETVLFIPDTHVPFHDKKAFALMLKLCKKLRPDVVVLLGDFADFYSLSFHDKSPERRLLLEEEAEAVCEALDELDKVTKRAYRKIYVCGNHENRFNRYIMRHAQQFFGLTSISELFQLEDRGWEFVPYRDFALVGKLAVTHDTGGYGMNAHRKALKDMGGVSTLIGHTHRMSIEYKQNALGKFITCGMMGWLGDPTKVDYAHRAKVAAWVQGVAIGHKLRNGTVFVTPVPFHKYQCVFNGKLLDLKS